MQTHEFGPFRVYVRERLLFHRNLRVDLKGKAFDVLLTMLAREGSALSKEELMQSVWADTALEESNLTVAVSHLRKTLREAGCEHEYIETLTGRGYRFSRSGVPPRRAQRSATRLKAAVCRSEPKSALAADALFIGRELELEALQRLASEARAGSLRTVLVTGDAGAGKTTLIEAFLTTLGQGQQTWLAQGACVRLFAAGEPYLAVLSALRRLCRGVDGARPLDVLKQVAPTWAVRLPELLTASELVVLEQRLTMTASARRMLGEMGSFVATLAPLGSFIWCIEDLHWADPWTLELLAYLSQRADLPRTLILASSRPPESSAASSAFAEVYADLQLRGACHALKLRCLTFSQVVGYFAARFVHHDFPDSLARSVYEQTLGTPLFVAQWADALIEEGMVRPSFGVWHLEAEQAVVSAYLPSKTAQTIEMQLDRLSARERSVLDAASVCGDSFAVAAVAAVLQEDPVEVERACLTWSRQERFVRIVADAEWVDGTKTTICAFSLPVYREVLVRRLGTANRARLEQLFEAHIARAGQAA